MSIVGQIAELNTTAIDVERTRKRKRRRRERRDRRRKKERKKTKRRKKKADYKCIQNKHKYGQKQTRKSPHHAVYIPAVQEHDGL